MSVNPCDQRHRQLRFMHARSLHGPGFVSMLTLQDLFPVIPTWLSSMPIASSQKSSECQVRQLQLLSLSCVIFSASMIYPKSLFQITDLSLWPMNFNNSAVIMPLCIVHLQHTSHQPTVKPKELSRFRNRQSNKQKSPKEM